MGKVVGVVLVEVMLEVELDDAVMFPLMDADPVGAAELDPDGRAVAVRASKGDLRSVWLP
jgi:hypothetical protein